MVAVEHALEVTQNRIMPTKVVIFPAQSAVVFALDMPILPTVATVHIDRCAAAAVNLFVFSTEMAACLASLIVDDRPCAAGGITTEPGPAGDRRRPSSTGSRYSGLGPWRGWGPE